ncbi:MAG: DinB family protein [Anaerolineales bacterium]|jgi:hypothetical protein
MEELIEYRSRLIGRFAGQAEDLRLAIERFSQEALHRPLETGGWTPHQVLAHVRDVELQAFLPRMVRILEQNHPTLEDFDEQAWMAEHYHAGESTSALLTAFGKARESNPVLTKQLPSQAWNRMAFHPHWGHRTLQWWVEYAVAHTDEHLGQLGA